MITDKMESIYGRTCNFKRAPRSSAKSCRIGESRTKKAFTRKKRTFIQGANGENDSIHLTST